MTYTEIRDLITANETQNGSSDRITGAEVRAVDNAIIDKVEEVEGMVGGGSTLFALTGTNTATGAVVGELDGNTLSVQQGGTSFLSIDPLNGESFIQSFNATDDGNWGRVQGNTEATFGSIKMQAVFNNEVKQAEIEAFADATTSTLTYIADTHTFNVPASNGGFSVYDGSNFWLRLNSEVGGEFARLFSFSSESSSSSSLNLMSNSGDGYQFDLYTNDGTHTVQLIGDAAAQTITLTAANGVIVANDNFQITTPKTPASAAATGTIGQIAWDTGFLYVCISTDSWKRVAIAAW